jgi:Flp pilus assembly protein TadG
MLKELVTLVRRLGGAGNSGAVAIEFAITAPVLILLVLGISDYGILMNNSASLMGASRAGAEYLAVNWNDPQVANPTAGTEQQVCAFYGLTLSGSSCSPITPNVTSRVCTCVDGTTVTCPTVGSADPCPGRVLIYVGVQASENFTPLGGVTNFLRWAFFPSNPLPLTATTWVRVQ